MRGVPKSLNEKHPNNLRYALQVYGFGSRGQVEDESGTHSWMDAFAGLRLTLRLCAYIFFVD